MTTCFEAKPDGIDPRGGGDGPLQSAEVGPSRGSGSPAGPRLRSDAVEKLHGARGSGDGDRPPSVEDCTSVVAPPAENNRDIEPCDVSE